MGIKGLANVRIIRYTPNGRHVWVEYLSGDKKGLICKKPASIIPTAEEREYIRSQQELGNRDVSKEAYELYQKENAEKNV